MIQADEFSRAAKLRRVAGLSQFAEASEAERSLENAIHRISEGAGYAAMALALAALISAPFFF